MEWVLRGNRLEIFQTGGIACVPELKVLHGLNVGYIKGSSSKGWKWRHGTIMKGFVCHTLQIELHLIDDRKLFKDLKQKIDWQYRQLENL